MQLLIEFPQPKVRKPSYRQERNAESVRRGDTHFHPRKCRDIIRSACKANYPEWTTFCDLCDLTDMDTQLVDLLLEWMQRRRQIEAAPLYFIRRHDPLIPRDRLIRPDPKDYMGFEYGYRIPQH